MRRELVLLVVKLLLMGSELLLELFFARVLCFHLILTVIDLVLVSFKLTLQLNLGLLLFELFFHFLLKLVFQLKFELVFEIKSILFLLRELLLVLLQSLVFLSKLVNMLLDSYFHFGMLFVVFSGHCFVQVQHHGVRFTFFFFLLVKEELQLFFVRDLNIELEPEVFELLLVGFNLTL